MFFQNRVLKLFRKTFVFALKQDRDRRPPWTLDARRTLTLFAVRSMLSNATALLLERFLFAGMHEAVITALQLIWPNLHLPGSLFTIYQQLLSDNKDYLSNSIPRK